MNEIYKQGFILLLHMSCMLCLFRLALMRWVKTGTVKDSRVLFFGCLTALACFNMFIQYSAIFDLLKEL